MSTDAIEALTESVSALRLQAAALEEQASKLRAQAAAIEHCVPRLQIKVLPRIQTPIEGSEANAHRECKPCLDGMPDDVLRVIVSMAGPWTLLTANRHICNVSRLEAERHVSLNDSYRLAAYERYTRSDSRAGNRARSLHIAYDVKPVGVLLLVISRCPNLQRLTGCLMLGDCGKIFFGILSGFTRLRRFELCMADASLANCLEDISLPSSTTELSLCGSGLAAPGFEAAGINISQCFPKSLKMVSLRNMAFTRWEGLGQLVAGLHPLRELSLIELSYVRSSSLLALCQAQIGTLRYLKVVYATRIHEAEEAGHHGLLDDICCLAERLLVLEIGAVNNSVAFPLTTRGFNKLPDSLVALSVSSSTAIARCDPLVPLVAVLRHPRLRYCTIALVGAAAETQATIEGALLQKAILPYSGMHSDHDLLAQFETD